MPKGSAVPVRMLPVKDSEWPPDLDAEAAVDIRRVSACAPARAAIRQRNQDRAAEYLRQKEVEPDVVAPLRAHSVKCPCDAMPVWMAVQRGKSAEHREWCVFYGAN